MEREGHQGGVDILLDRAAAPREKRYIYSGESKPVQPGYIIKPNHRRGHRRVSTFSVILVLFGAGIASVLYVNSILTINRLAMEVDRLQARYDTIVNTNTALRAEVSRKSSWERISAIATEQLGLVYPKEQPTILELGEIESGGSSADGGR